MNKVILMGRITRDVELKMTQSGINMCDFSVAVDRRFTKAGEERQTDFINCRAFRSTAEFISKWFTKGRMIAVVGSIQNNNWTDNNGEKHYSTNVIVDEAYFCGDKSANGPAVVPSPIVNQNFDSNPFPGGDINDFVPIDSEDDLPF